MYDYIIVGSGIAGISMAETLEQNNKSFIVIDSHKRSSSLVAGGMFNPVVLKRFTEVWKVEKQLEVAKQFYPNLEKKLGIKFWYPTALYRRIYNTEEQNNWFVACDKPSLQRYLEPKLSRVKVTGVDSKFGFGIVKDTGFLETNELIEFYRKYLLSKQMYLCEEFNYNLLSYTSEGIAYRDIKAKNIIFAQGIGLQENPFFKDLPLDGTKGELLVVRIPNLDIDFMLKGNVFVIPLGNDLFKVGATYNWQDKSDLPTSDARKELIAGLKEIIDLDFEVLSHVAGVRPTVKDRRPLLGRSLESDRIFVLNGLGTRGVLLGPFLAKELFNHIEYGQELDENISIHRYKKFRIKK
ncbi:NAD(P)/FAD-dependent oxidoreductase [Myroides sp. LJL119]